jgi:hypothetical protein
VEEGLGSGDSFGGVLDEALPDQILTFFGDLLESLVVEVELALDDVLDDFPLVSAREGDLAREHDVEDDAHGPNVDLLVVPLQEDFRCDVVGGATHGGHGLVIGKVLGESEVDHFDASEVVLLVDHEVLRLDVSVGDLVVVQVLEGTEQLLHDEGGHLLAQVLAFDDVVE